MAWNLARFLPSPAGTIGDDYSLFLPWLLAGSFWHRSNPWAAMPAFLPSFCGGVPFLFNPQSMYLSVPQLLAFWLPPVRAALLTWVLFGLAGGAGMLALARCAFAASLPAAALAASLFMLNGFYADRMIFGHVTYHGFMLLPLIALAVLHGPGRVLPRSAAAGLLLAYVLYSGGTNVLLPMGLGIALLACVAAAAGRLHPSAWTVAACGLALFLALSAYKLLPALAFAQHVVRPVALRMAGDILSLAAGAAVSLFVPQALAHMDLDRLAIDRVEFEYGVGLLPLLLPLAALAALRRRRQLGCLWRRPLPLAALVALLAVPLLANWDAIGLRWLLLHLPVVRSMSFMLRFWAAYVPLLCVLAACSLDCLLRRPALRAWGAAAGIALAIAQSAATDMAWYRRPPYYDPARIESAWAGAAVPAVTAIADPWAGGVRTTSGRNDPVAEGISPFPCYEPMFGYRMQAFPLGRLAPGPVMAERDGRLNLRNPVCYVFPEANRCAPGDAFTAAQSGQAAAFAAYRPFEYAWPWWEYAAAWVSGLALAGCVGALAAAGVGKTVQRSAPADAP